MKRFIYMAMAGMLVFSSCAKEPSSTERIPLVFSVAGTKAPINYTQEDYFASIAGVDEITVTSSDNTEYTYVYNDGVFKGKDSDNTYFFALENGTEPSFTIEWNHTTDALVRDQSTREAFLRADRLYATLQNIVPVETVPIFFEHERSKITFTVSGAYADRAIESLEVGDFKAYCDPDTNTAELIYIEGNNLIPDLSEVKVKVAGLEVQTVIIDQSPDTLLAATNNGHVSINIVF